MNTVENLQRIALASHLLSAAAGVLANLLQHTVGAEYVAMGLDMVHKAFETLDRIHLATPPPLGSSANGGHEAQAVPTLVQKRRTEMIAMAIHLQGLLQSVEGGDESAP